MPNLKKIGKGGYFYAYFYDSHRLPKQKGYALKTNRKDLAMKRYVDVVDRWERGKFDPWNPAPVVSRLTVGEAKEKFFADRTNLRPKSVKAYTSALNLLIGALPAQMMLAHVRREHLHPLLVNPMNSLTGEPLKPATVQYRHRHLASFFGWCKEKGHVEDDPMALIKPPKGGNRLPEYLTWSDYESLLRCIEADYERKREARQVKEGAIIWLKDVITVAVFTGMRIGELVSIRWPDVDFENDMINIRNRDGFQTKTGDERAIPMSSEVAAVLARLRERGGEQGYVFTGKKGGRLNAEYTSKQFKYYVRLAGLPEIIRFHSLRHTCASWLIQRGTSLANVQEILGHTSIKMVEHYKHMAPEGVKRAIRSAFG